MRWRLPKAAVINRSKTNQTSRPKRTGGDWQDGVPAFRGWTIDEGAAEPSSQARRGRAERLWAQTGNGESDIGKPGSKGRYTLGRLGRVILSLQRNKLSRRSSQWTIPEDASMQMRTQMPTAWLRWLAQEPQELW